MSEGRGEKEWEGQGPGFGSDPKELIREHTRFITGPARLPAQSLGTSRASGKQRRGNQFCTGSVIPNYLGMGEGILSKPFG